MWMLVLVVVVLGSLCLDKSQSQISDPCHLIHVEKSYESDLQYLGIPKADSSDLEIPVQCLTGDVNWHSPVGSLLLYTYRNNGGYDLCIEESWGFNIGELRDLTGQQDKILPLPTLDKPSCTRDLYGQTKLLITANSSAMITFEYKINHIY